jgi:orotidine-5'-phosphate decarboxylase
VLTEQTVPTEQKATKVKKEILVQLEPTVLMARKVTKEIKVILDLKVHKD